MEPKMLEFPNPYCQDRDQGDLDDLIFAVGGPAGPSERWRLDRKNGACYIEWEKLYFSWYWQYWMQISLVFSKMGTNQNLLRQYIMRWLHFDSNSSLESKWSFFVARIWISCLKPCYSLSQCVCCSVYIYIYIYLLWFGWRCVRAAFAAHMVRLQLQSSLLRMYVVTYALLHGGYQPSYTPDLGVRHRNCYGLAMIIYCAR